MSSDRENDPKRRTAPDIPVEPEVKAEPEIEAKSESMSEGEGITQIEKKEALEPQTQKASEDAKKAKSDVEPEKLENEDTEQQSAETFDDMPVWLQDMDTYPLREPSEDPGWARKIVKVWVGVALFCLVFILTLLVLGLIYD